MTSKTKQKTSESESDGFTHHHDSVNLPSVEWSEYWLLGLKFAREFWMTYASACQPIEVVIVKSSRLTFV